MADLRKTLRSAGRDLAEIFRHPFENTYADDAGNIMRTRDPDFDRLSFPQKLGVAFGILQRPPRSGPEVITSIDLADRQP